mmetsp:Transcript_24762/g.45384  ORF Transcript_24762/g.45384 Transcript_24762/m.45384 type:complete len:366 (+) Transcript_24762:30-1127(+)
MRAVEADHTRTPSPRQRWIVSNLVVIGIAVSSSVATQFAKATQDDFGDAVQSPLFMTWSATLFNLFLAVPAVVQICLRNEAGLLVACRHKLLLPGSWAFTHAGFQRRAFALYLFWLASNYSYQYALKLAPTGLVASLMSTTPAYVAAASVVFLARPVGRLAWFAVCVSIVGSLLVVEPWRSARSASTGGEMFTGLLLAVVAALGATAYKITFKCVFGEPPPEVVGVVLAWVGVYAATVGTAWLCILLHFEWESVVWSRLPWHSLIPGILSSLVYNFLIGWGIAISDPLFISLGAVLGVPLNAYADWMLRRILPDAVQAGGIACILLGFFMLLYADMVRSSASQASDRPWQQGMSQAQLMDPQVQA